MNTELRRHPLEEAAQKYGSEAALARALGVSRGALNQWKKQGRNVPAEHAPEIERLTGVPCERLCPSIRWEVLRRPAEEIQHA
ncbi:transcriptional regulator [Allopusillimonas ginsengisoli]|uniref:transcriptional regulator n=1 Tax=Allopusillimonas ginsengisoli TaxID=453575 RepID=UPI0010215F10|nr:Cro/CI family transcriptional regulator [Allopusillimonas ginsengisoli]TEA71881.1 Cro/Cl family transcriptional regulator [Allopusillimonas ginsengisoli]